MNIRRQIAVGVLIAVLLLPDVLISYPIDGYSYSGIRRLMRLQHILDGVVTDKKPIEGALLSFDSIHLNLVHLSTDKFNPLPETDPTFQSQVDRFFTALDRNYSISVLDMSDPQNLRYASRKGSIGYQPGSVGKLAVLAGLFCQLEMLYPDDFNARVQLLKDKKVVAGQWAMTDEHTVPFYNPDTKEFFKRQVQPKDIFSLYEWTDHMMSVSNNGAASVLWREVILMSVFEDRYPSLQSSSIDSFFTKTPKATLSDIAVQVVNSPLRDLGIDEDEWRLGRLFTRGGSNIIPGKGGSTGTTDGLMKFIVAIEQGKVVDEASSLEMKRLMYMTDRRIRYASAPALSKAAVYFKSGSLYKCDRVKDPECGKYRGNVQNYMNSVIVVEHQDGRKYVSVLMSNVLGKNSNLDHAELGAKIDRLISGT